MRTHSIRRSTTANLQWLFLPLLLLAVCVASVLLGAVNIPLEAAIEAWRSSERIADSPILSILVYQRLPRTLAALLAGAGLALAGAVFQALLRNPLATPYTLGVANFAALGAWSAFLIADAGWLGGGFLALHASQVLAFLFALADVLLIYLLAARRGGASPSVLLLAGVTLGMLANSGILLSRYLAQPDRLVAMDRWLMGGVDVLGFSPILTLMTGVVPCTAILIMLAPRLDQFSFNPELAAARGIHVARLQIVAFVVSSLLTAIVVSEVGPIGFVGLVVPHVVRAFTGPGHLRLLPFTVLAGGIFLCGCDIVARLLMPGEIPIGIVTTFVGAPFFLYLLLRRRFSDWAL